VVDVTVTAMIMAAGIGSRMRAPIAKQYLSLLDRPILVHTLERFDQHPLIDEIVLVCGVEDMELIHMLLQSHGIGKVASVVAGGSERQYSVMEGLKQATGEWVLVHDGVRPLLREELLDSILALLPEKESVIPGVPVKDTIKQVNESGRVEQTPDRSSLWAIQTPQAFRLSTLKKAYAYADHQGFLGTDDASVMEFYGQTVYVTMGDYENIKITTPEDLEWAETCLRKREKR
jgi:2-C-methyl-D-erythritol 4-phosphate cytidylyltransferase